MSDYLSDDSDDDALYGTQSRLPEFSTEIPQQYDANYGAISSSPASALWGESPNRASVSPFDIETLASSGMPIAANAGGPTGLAPYSGHASGFLDGTNEFADPYNPSPLLEEDAKAVPQVGPINGAAIAPTVASSVNDQSGTSLVVPITFQPSDALLSSSRMSSSYSATSPLGHGANIDAMRFLSGASGDGFTDNTTNDAESNFFPVRDSSKTPNFSVRYGAGELLLEQAMQVPDLQSMSPNSDPFLFNPDASTKSWTTPSGTVDQVGVWGPAGEPGSVGQQGSADDGEHGMELWYQTQHGQPYVVDPKTMQLERSLDIGKDMNDSIQDPKGFMRGVLDHAIRYQRDGGGDLYFTSANWQNTGLREFQDSPLLTPAGRSVGRCGVFYDAHMSVDPDNGMWEVDGTAYLVKRNTFDYSLDGENIGKDAEILGGSLFPNKYDGGKLNIQGTPMNLRFNRSYTFRVIGPLPPGYSKNQ